MKLVVIGIDGAGFELIDPWIEEGILPNIEKIKKFGAWANMESVLPPVTSPNWKCYSTGKNPGKIGIFWWENIDWLNKSVYYPSKRKHGHKEIWDIISEAGMKVAVLGMPTTYPPQQVNGIMIAGGPDCEDTGFAYPREIENELTDKGWQNHPKASFEHDTEKWCEEIKQIISSSFDETTKYIDNHNIDFLQITLFYINSLHHFLWNSQATKEAWQIIDSRVGDIIDRDFDVLLMSDHGSNKIETVFNINKWLMQEGYLKQKPALSSILHVLGLTRPRLRKIALSLGILQLIRKFTPKRLLREIPESTSEVIKEAKTGRVNWNSSRALASGQGPVYLNPADNNKESLIKEIIEKLETLVNPSTGKKIASKVYRKNEIYTGPYIDDAPELIIDQSKGIHISGNIGQKEVFEPPKVWKAENKKFGLFMAYGPNIKKYGLVENVSILDLAPTILHLMGLAVPNDMDGKPLLDILEKGPEVRYEDTTERETLQKKIRMMKKKGKF